MFNLFILILERVGLIIIFAAGLVRSYLKRRDVPIIIIGMGLLTATAGYVLHLLDFDVDAGMVALVALGLVSLYLAYLALRFRKLKYFYILL